MTYLSEFCEISLLPPQSTSNLEDDDNDNTVSMRIFNERHRDLFTCSEYELLKACLHSSKEVVYSVDDTPIGPCECAIYKEYSNVFQYDSPGELSSSHPYVCKHCTIAYQKGDKARISSPPRQRRTYYNFAGDAKLVLYPLEDWLGDHSATHNKET